MRPFIIWTLQRTGGTNFAANVIKASGVRTTEHEPFNRGRAFGHVTDAWLAGYDTQRLDEAMTSLVADGLAIKHCVETVPWEVTAALARRSASCGYNHLFLYRRNSADRLLSLHFARETGIWGWRMAEMKKAEFGEEYLKEMDFEPIPVSSMIEHEEHCLQLLCQSWKSLLQFGCQPLTISYEQIYRCSDFDDAIRDVANVLSGLGFAEMEARRDLVEKIIKTGDQGSRENYSRFLGVEELVAKGKNIASFVERISGDVTTV